MGLLLECSSGKTIIIASTEGNQSVPGNEDVKVELNIYRKINNYQIKEMWNYFKLTLFDFLDSSR